MRHESYWALRESPFRNGQDTQYFFASSTHEEALARLQFLVDERRLLGVLSGGGGSGKSLLLEFFARQLRRQARTVYGLGLLGHDLRSFRWALAAALGTNPRVDHDGLSLWRQTVDRLREHRFLGEQVTLLFDDAERAQPEVRTELLRLLKSTAELSLTIVLAGHSAHLTELGDELLQLCDLHVHVETWEAADIRDFLHTSLARAGREGGREVFDESAVTRLRELTEGVPRRVSQLAELALVAGAGRRLEQIDAETLDAVFQELCAFTPAAP